MRTYEPEKKKDTLSQEAILQMAASWLPDRLRNQPLAILRDTTDFFGINFNDILVLGGIPYLIRHNAREGRFGLDDEIKYWVKRAIDLTDGNLRIIKMVFYEKFTAHVGDVAFECFRSPKKEARILKLVQGHPNFMQGRALPDERGNTVRIIDFIRGSTLASVVEDLPMDHRAYFFERLPGILDGFLEALEAIRYLHDHGEKHGDIRRDHLLIDRDSGRYRWIDFDFNYRHRENIYGYDLFGLGNILVFLAGKGDVLFSTLQHQKHPALAKLTPADMNMVFHHRLADLQKVFPYIPDELNLILRHFSRGTHWFYEHTAQLIDDLGSFRSRMR